jgi:hypothetical protein
MKKIRIGITGGRDYANEAKVRHVLDLAYSRLEDKMFLVVGCARGADKHARTWAADTLPPDQYEIYKADWDTYGKAAGHLRNKEMATSGLKLLIAFPGGTGTANMKKQCADLGIKILEIKE